MSILQFYQVWAIAATSTVLMSLIWTFSKFGIPTATKWGTMGSSVKLWGSNLQRMQLGLVFASSVLWTEKIHTTELNWTVVQSIFWLWLPKFGVITVAGCLISKIIQNCSKTSWNQLQLVKQSHVLHSLVTTFITFNLIFDSSKTVKNWERYN